MGNTEVEGYETAEVFGETAEAVVISQQAPKSSEPATRSFVARFA